MEFAEPVRNLASVPCDTPLATAFVIKVAELCNLDCSYCYMYRKGDTSFRNRPKFMSVEIAAAMLARIAAYAHRHDLECMGLALHGGEPLLIGKQWVLWFLKEAQRVTKDTGVNFSIGIQSNGILLDAEWVELFRDHEVAIGLSCDGPEKWNDQARPDFSRRGSYKQVRKALDLLASTVGVNWGVLAVVNPEAPAREVLQHFVSLGATSIDFLWPEYNHDSPPPWAAGTMGRYFCDLFDCWYDELASPPRIRWLENAMALLLGGQGESDALGPHPITDIMVESDGTWEPLDTLRICADGITRTGLDVRTTEVENIWEVPLYQIGVKNQDLLPVLCERCAYRQVCGGGYLPHRFRRETGFRNPSVYCADILVVLAHIRKRIAIDLEKLSRVTQSDGQCQL